MCASAALAAFLLGAAACRRGASTGERTVVLDLIDAFPATDSGGPTMEIRAGDRRAADSFAEGWSPPERGEDGRDVAWASAPKSSVSFDAGPRPLDTRLVLDCIVASESARLPALFLRLNG